MSHRPYFRLAQQVALAYSRPTVVATSGVRYERRVERFERHTPVGVEHPAPSRKRAPHGLTVRLNEVQNVQHWTYEVNDMAVHEEVLATAQRLCRERRSRHFTIEDVVRALPHLNENTVKTHVSSRCCVNAPKNHGHRLPYFRRLRRGVYEICKTYSLPVAQATDEADRDEVDGVRETIHTVISESEGAYVAECLEVGVVTQGESLDETLRNLREAVELFMDDEEPAALGLVPNPRLAISFETAVR